MEEGRVVKGLINGKVKGGLTVMCNGIRAFLPGSLVDVRPIKDTTPFENKESEFKVIKLDRKRNNVVVSRKAVLEQSMGAERESLLANLKEGARSRAWSRTSPNTARSSIWAASMVCCTSPTWPGAASSIPSEVVTVGDEVTAVVLKFDQEKNRVSLGLKQLGEDPWVGLSRRYPTGTRMFGKVANLTDYGCFVEIEPGIEGLVHVSEMDWTNKNVNPSKMVSLGDEVEVMVLEIDEDRRRISLGMKQCKSNPWDDFAMNYKKGDKVRGQIKSITDFGVFIGLPGGIDGLVHLSDLSWSLPGEEALRNYRKGEEVEAVVLAIDVEKERISLGVKQMENDPFNAYVATHDKGHRQGHRQVPGRQGRRGDPGRRGGRLPARFRSVARPCRGHPHPPEGRRRGRDRDHQYRPQEPPDQPVDQGQGCRRASEALKKLASEQSTGTTNLGALLKAKLDNKSAE
jgi:small subunit ribosomal protein S1